MRFISCLLWAILTCLPCQLYAQAEPKFAFLRTAHYATMPYMMPDYFQEEAWTDSLMQVIAQSIKSTLKVQKVDYKQHQAITYHPTSLPEEGTGYNFTNTAYEYFAEVQTSVTLGHNRKNLPELDKGLFTLYLRVYDQKQRRVLQKNAQVRFVIEPDKEGMGDAWLSAPQFKQLYNQALHITFQKQKNDNKTWNFQQTPSAELQDFITKANPTHIYAEARGQYKWVMPDSSFTLGLELQMPHYEAKTHRREATLMWAGKVRNQVKGLLSDKKPQELFIQFTRPQFNFAALQSGEVLDIAETDEQKNVWTWLAYQHNGLVKVYQGDELKAVLVRQEGYKCYLSHRLRTGDQAMIGYLLTADVLVRALQKQYDFR
jgi:hypothetical protein